MIYFLFWIIISVLVIIWANKLGRSLFWCALGCVLLNPVIVAIYYLVVTNLLKKPKPGEMSADKKKRDLIGSIIVLLLPIIIVFLLGIFPYKVFWVPSSSMEPTFNIGDRFLVNSVSYSLRDPKRGEIVVFKMTEKPERLNTKRIIGLPGERLELKEGMVYVNEKKIDEPYSLNKDYSDFGPVKVPTDGYFVLGDNRPASADSRYWGFIPKSNLIGPAVIRIYPFDKLGPIR